MRNEGKTDQMPWGPKYWGKVTSATCLLLLHISPLFLAFSGWCLGEKRLNIGAEMTFRWKNGWKMAEFSVGKGRRQAYVKDPTMVRFFPLDFQSKHAEIVPFFVHFESEMKGKTGMMSWRRMSPMDSILLELIVNHSLMLSLIIYGLNCPIIDR